MNRHLGQLGVNSVASEEGFYGKSGRDFFGRAHFPAGSAPWAEPGSFRCARISGIRRSRPDSSRDYFIAYIGVPTADAPNGVAAAVGRPAALFLWREGAERRH